MDTPLCECHGKPMHKQGLYKNKQRWRCAVKNSKYQSEYHSRHPEKKRERDRRLSRTPGSYRYNTMHGIGLPGALHKMRARKRRRNRANAADEARIQEILKVYPDLEVLLNGDFGT